MKQSSILIVEKNKKIAATIKATVRKSGYTPHILENPEEILMFLEKTPVDVALINVRFQGAGDESLCSMVRSDPQFSRYPLIILYGKVSTATRSDFLGQGADDFVPMPFTPADLVTLVEVRLRPLEKLTSSSRALSALEQSDVSEKFRKKVPPLDGKGPLEMTPLPGILSRLFLYRESGVLTIMIKKEARTIFFRSGEIAFAESLSRKDDLADYMSRNRAGKGSGREIIAARNQAGGAGSDPNAFRLILKETHLMEPGIFDWWLRMHVIELIANLFTFPLGSFQWQTLPMPGYVTAIKIPPFSTSRLIWEGVRRMKKWWVCRDLLPEEKSVPVLVPDFIDRARESGMTAAEAAAMGVVNSKRTLLEIREVCHQSMPMIDNFLFTCHQLQLMHFERDEQVEFERSLNIYDEISETDESEEEPVFDVPVIPRKREPDLEIPVTRELTTKELPEIPTIEVPQVPEEEHALPPRQVTARVRVYRPSMKREIPKLDLTTGNLIEKMVPDIFQHAIACQFTGSIEFKFEDVLKTVFWRRGKIISATSNKSTERFDNFVFKKSLITPEQKEELDGLPENKAGSPNELLRRKFLTIEQIFVEVKEQVEAIVQELFLWTDGTYLFTENTKAPQDIVPMNISPAAVVMSALRELQDWKHLKSRLPIDGDRVQLAEEGKNYTGLNLSPLELRILNVLQDPLPVGEVIRRVAQETESIRHSLFAMEISGILMRSGSPF